MSTIFISYRRDGGGFVAKEIYEGLTSIGYSVYYNIEEYNPGGFNTKIYESIEKADDFILILNKGALDRCDLEDDWVRKEIKHAIKHHRNIIPILLSGFAFPDNLPDDISEIRDYQGIIADSEYCESILDVLCSRFLVSKDNKINRDNLSVQSKENEIQSERECFWKYDEDWSNECLVETNNRLLWKERTLYTGQKRIVEETIIYKHVSIDDYSCIWIRSKNPPDGYVYAYRKIRIRKIRYENLDKWVTNVNGLGEYIYNINIAKQYKYAYRVYNKTYSGQPFEVDETFNCIENDCEEVLDEFEKHICGIHNFCKINEIKEKIDYKYFSCENIKNILNCYSNTVSMFPYCLICDKFFTDEDVQLLEKIYKKYIDVKSRMEAPLVIIAIGFSEKALAYIAKQENYIPFTCDGFDALYDLASYIGCYLNKKDNKFETVSLSTLNFIFILEKEIRFSMEIGTEIRVNNTIDLLMEECEHEKNSEVVKNLEYRIIRLKKSL